MKKLLLILLCLPLITLAQQTYVPDDGFEQWLINLGYDTVLDDSVATASIDTVTDLYVESPSQFLTIVDIIGIEDFTALETLEIAETFIFDLDVSSNINLTHLEIQTLNTVSLTSLNVSGATDLTHLIIDGGSLASLDLSNSTALNHLRVWFNSLTSLDVSNCPNLTYLDCRYNNQLTTLNISNGNNTNFDTTSFWTGFPTYEVYVGNSPAECIEVDDVAWATANLTAANYNIDPNDFFSTNCATAYGCTNTLACNYDSLAVADDGSCIYPTVWAQSFTICSGDSVVVGNSVYDTTGSYVDTTGGCDSVIITHISLDYYTIWYQTHLICDGDSIAVGNSIYDTAGVYMDTLNTSNGCDSVVHTYLMIDENTSSYDTLSVTASIVWNGIPLNVSGDYSVTLTNSVGCDSIVNLNLTVTTTGISEIVNNKSNLIKISDMLGQETPYRKNTPLFYIYDDGTVEKRIVIE